MACLFMLYEKKKVKKERKVKKSNVDGENTKLIFVGVEYANEDAATVYVGGHFRCRASHLQHLEQSGLARIQEKGKATLSQDCPCLADNQICDPHQILCSSHLAVSPNLDQQSPLVC